MAELDRDRVLAKIDDLDVYLNELKGIAPQSFEEYQEVEKKRACERLLQVSIETVIDICSLFVSGLRLGLPAEEEDLFKKLVDIHIISEEMGEKLREMRGFRNILVHEYAHVDDRLVYEAVKAKLGDFNSFKREALKFLRNKAGGEGK
ncbi:DUF86 domain-containing protein [Candidatus Bipolaricaulota bacterium]|nr:DUF86 domain-containing protein [Candidatus Bipolaricaulota bacterium]HBR10061.1 DUF86 domain-containing protein [Candidatus Acetothermia bacterium]